MQPKALKTFDEERSSRIVIRRLTSPKAFALTLTMSERYTAHKSRY